MAALAVSMDRVREGEIEEAFNIYKLIRDDDNHSDGEQKEIFDTINEAYLSAEFDDMRLWIDPENDQVLTFDISTIDAEIKDIDEVKKWYEEDTLEMTADFYERLRESTRDDEA